jgi:DNA-binding NarL/FixJ family response regulator
MTKQDRPPAKAMPPKLRVVLADDHALVRAGIRALLEKITGVEVVAEAGDGLETLKAIKELKPDVVLLDIAMPGLGGLEVLKRVKSDYPETRVIVLTVHEDQEYADHAIAAGAVGFLPKSAASAELELALRMVAEGEIYFSPGISRQPAGSAPTAGVELTPRQREVLALIANGHSTKDIALALSISAKTVETHRAQLMERLQIFDVAGLVRYAIKTGLVKIED